jgi:hypothetical protein
MIRQVTKLVRESRIGIELILIQDIKQRPQFLHVVLDRRTSQKGDVLVVQFRQFSRQPKV